MKVVESGKIIDEWLMLGWFANMWAATNDPLQAKIEKLEKERNLAWDKGYTQGRDDAHQTITDSAE